MCSVYRCYRLLVPVLLGLGLGVGIRRLLHQLTSDRMSLRRVPKLPVRATSVSIVQSSAAPEVSSDGCCSVCQICQHNAGRYNCPRCSTLYCSVTCYRSHSRMAECTEAFYKDRVNTVLQLEVKENAADMMHILERHERQQQVLGNDTLPVVVSRSTANTGTTELSRDELVQILSLLEQNDGNEVALMKALSHQSMRRLRLAIHHAMADVTHGQLSGLHEWILEPWFPWWRSHLPVVNEEDVGRDMEYEETTGTGRTTQPTLDEQILAVPHFTTLVRRQSHSLDTPSQLQFNLVNILYSAVTTLWLYHGATNAATEMPMEAYEALVQGSTVLSNDARYWDLDEALTSCECRFVETQAIDEETRGPNCNRLLQDVARLCQNHRFVARALLEMGDIVKAAVRQAKHNTSGDSGIDESIPAMRSVGKKVQFYLSWSLLYKSQVAPMQDAIFEWIGRDENRLFVAAPGRQFRESLRNTEHRYH